VLAQLDQPPTPRLKPSVPGWCADPCGRNDFRYWNQGWTDQVSTRGIEGIDPMNITAE
jgi:hypothetical protein